MRGAFGSLWEAGGCEPFPLLYVDDLVVDPAYRQQGFHRVIMNFALRDLAVRGHRYVVNLSASKVTCCASMKMQWRNAGWVGASYRRTLRKTAVDLLSGRARHLPFIWRWARNFSSLSGPTGNALFDRLDARFGASNGRRDTGIPFVQETPLVREMSELVARLPRDGRIRHVRDEKFFGWRFNNPLSSYRFLYIGDERLRGYLVLQRPPLAIGERAAIVDWEADSDQVRAELLAAALEHGKFPEVCAWQQGASPATARLLRHHGFKPIRTRHEKSILVRSVRDDELNAPWLLGGRSLDDADQWDLRMIYSMHG